MKKIIFVILVCLLFAAGCDLEREVPNPVLAYSGVLENVEIEQGSAGIYTKYIFKFSDGVVIITTSPGEKIWTTGAEYNVYKRYDGLLYLRKK